MRGLVWILFFLSLGCGREPIPSKQWSGVRPDIHSLIESGDYQIQPQLFRFASVLERIASGHQSRTMAIEFVNATKKLRESKIPRAWDLKELIEARTINTRSRAKNYAEFEYSAQRKWKVLKDSNADSPSRSVSAFDFHKYDRKRPVLVLLR